ncbi:alkylhydroperoxidase domain protein [Microbacterium sp. A93]|uniref:alkylhydroperoxidase domain protein n=1 Tax=Microbacterium sp. A93 TaxID=3450716 RepID=UPI003F42FD00
MTEISVRPTVLSYDLPHPQGFTRDTIGWVPWLGPLPSDEFTDRHRAGLLTPLNPDFDYFRLLVRDPEVLRARTLMDRDIFTKESDGGLPRAERELAATAASRTNGCVLCAAAHGRKSATYSKRTEDVDRLLDEGLGVDLGDRWNAIIAASEALTQSPLMFDVEDITALRDVGLKDIAIVDLIQSAAFFNWANRLMLSLGRPVAAS